jgi:hypothetical protein
LAAGWLSERQIAANRRNAEKSTGPRSDCGKKRATQNAFCHGLTLPISAEFERQVEILTRQIAGDTEDMTTFEPARTAADAELELVRAQQVKTALIERIDAFGSFECSKHFPSLQAPRSGGSMNDWNTGRASARPRRPKAVDPLATMPVQEPHDASSATSPICTATNPALLREETGQFGLSR